MASIRRRNPSVLQTAKSVLNVSTAKEAAVVGIGGGAALALGAALVGQSLGTSKVAQVGIAAAGGLLGAVALSQLGERTGKKMVSDMAPKVALGAFALGLWELGREPVMNLISKARSAVGLSGWTKEFDGLGQAYYDEFSVRKGVAGLGAGPNPILSAGDNPFMAARSLSGYEPLGDIVNTQRLGSFESETGFGGFVPEEANVRDQQIADQAKNSAGFYGGLGAATLFEPFISA